MLNKAVIISAIALAGEFASASLTGNDAIAKDKHTRMLKRRQLNGTVDNAPCRRGDGSGNSAGSFNNVKVIASSGNLTIVPSSYAAESRQPLSGSSSSSQDSSSQWSSSQDTRQALSDSSSSEQSSSSSSSSSWSWSSDSSASASSSAPAPSASVHGGVGTSPVSGGMSVVTSWSGSDVSVASIGISG